MDIDEVLVGTVSHILQYHNEVYKTNFKFQDIKDYDSLLSNGEWIRNECHFKPFGSGSMECEYCKLAKRLFSSGATKI